MRRTLAALAVLAACIISFAGCSSSRSTPPPASELPKFSFAGLRGTNVRVAVLDQRAGERDAQWTQRLQNDVAEALSSAGVNVTMDGATAVEVRLLRARSDFEDRQWNGCVHLTARVTGSPAEITSTGEACVAKSNLWGPATGDNVLRLAYADALVKLLSSLDSQL